MTDVTVHKACVAPSSSARPRRPPAIGHRRIWILTIAIAIGGLIGSVWLIGRQQPTGLGMVLDWWWLAIGFYVAELLVVHFQFRGDAHTLSMSEIPMILGLLLASPASLLIGQMLGSLVVLALHRRQRPVKIAFNLGQLALQTTAAVAVFEAMTGGSVGFDEGTVFAATVAMLTALAVGHVAVLSAIRSIGGTESRSETLRVLWLSSAGTVATSLLGVGAAITVVLAPRLWWVGLTPIGLVFVAYRAYIAQARDKGRVEALFDAATDLHRTPQIDLAVEAVATRVLDLVKAQTAAVVLLDSSDDPTGYLTVVDTHGRQDRMVAMRSLGNFDLAALSTGSDRRILTGAETQPIADLIGVADISQVMIEVLTVADEPVGMLAAINRVGNVSGFGDTDLQVLATLGSQLSTSLDNSRLTVSLAAVRTLQTQLEGLLESKDRLVASVSHELRTPLTGVIGLASVVRDSVSDDLDPETLGMLDLIVAQGNELSNIIDDLLAHTRAEAGTLTLRAERFDVTGEVATVAASHQLDLPDLPGPVWGFADPLRTRQILRNLITNARRYGGPTIRFVVASTFAWVTVSVVDDGSGVPASEEASIFEPYRSAHDQRHQPGSIGLGLSVSRSMAQMMGGDVTYERRGDHTWLTLNLPAVAPDAEIEA